MMNPETRATSRTKSTPMVGGEWVTSGSFLGSILAGMLLGYLADRWLGTDPWLVITGIVAGSYSGFMQMWKYSKQMEKGPDHG